MRMVLAALINGALVSAVLTLVVWLALKLAPRRVLNAATRYAVWWAAMAITVALPLAYLPWPSARPERTEISAMEITIQNEPAGLIADSVQAPPRPHLRFAVDIPAGPWLRWILIAWCVVTCGMLARLVWSFALIARRKAAAVPAPAHLAARVTALLSGRRRIRLALSPDISTAMAAGLFDPTILIPQRFLEQLAEDEVQQICVHEAAHLLRFDDYHLMFQRVLEAVFALHPGVRWIARQMDLEREIACDDFVVEAGGEAKPYAACLARVVELSGGVRGLPAVAHVAEGSSNLARRIDMLLDKTRNKRPRLLKARLAGLLIPLTLLAWMGAKTPALIAFQPPAPPPPPPPAAAPPAMPAAAPMPPPAPAPAPAPAPQPPPPPTATRMVRIPVIVADPLNRYVTGLDKENFRVIEDGHAQEIVEFSSDDEPMSVEIIFDVHDDQERGRQAVIDLIDTCNPQDEFILVSPGGDSQAVSGADVREYLSRLGVVTPLAPRANGPRPAHHRRRVRVTILDDQINWAMHDGSGMNWSGTALPGMASKLGVQFRNLYVLGYRGNHPGGEHQVHVDVLAPTGLPPLKISYPNRVEQ